MEKQEPSEEVPAMQMPPALQSAVDALLRDTPPGDVRAAADALSQR